MALKYSTRNDLHYENKNIINYSVWQLFTKFDKNDSNYFTINLYWSYVSTFLVYKNSALKVIRKFGLYTNI